MTLAQLVKNLYFMRSGNFIEVVKSADETVNNSAALQNDDELLFAIGANEKWEVEIGAFIDIGLLVAQFKFDINGPAAPSNVQLQFLTLEAAATSILVNALKNAFGSSSTAILVAATTGLVLIKGTISNGANAGTINFRWSQAVATLVDTKVLKGSWLRAIRSN